MASVLLVAMAACSGPSPRASKPDPKEARAASPKTMQFQFAAAGQPPVSAALPEKPLGTSGGSISGLELEVWSLTRRGDQAMLLVFALHNPAASAVRTGPDIGYLSAARDSSAKNTGIRTVSGIFAVDGGGLTQYLPYMVNPADDNTCLCTPYSQDDFGPDERRYFAALLASPPAGVKNVTVVTGLGSVVNVPLA